MGGRLLKKSGLLRRVDLHLGVHLQEVCQSARVIPVAVGDNDSVESRQINAEVLGVVLEDLRVVSGVEENAFSPVLHERGEPPILHQRRRGAERVVQDCDALDLLRVQRSRERQ